MVTNISLRNFIQMLAILFQNDAHFEVTMYVSNLKVIIADVND